MPRGWFEVPKPWVSAVYGDPNNADMSHAYGVNGPPSVAVGQSFCSDGSSTGEACGAKIYGINTCVNVDDHGTIYIDGQHPVDLDDLDPDLIAIDPLPSWIWYQDMADFAERISDKPAGRRLARALRGRGAFRHFKDELHEEYPHLVPVWYAFRDARAQHRAVEWLRHNDLVTAADAELFLAGHPEPEFP